MTTNSHTPLPFGGPLTAAAMEAPLGQLDAAISAVIATGSGASTTLTAQALAGQKNMVVADRANWVVGDVFWIGTTGGTHESGIIASGTGAGAGTLVATTNLVSTYASGSPVSKSPIELVDARGVYTSLGGRVSAIESRVYDVKRYGATGNGATDDSAAIQAAVDAAFAAGGGEVYVPNGIYRLVTEITIKTNVAIVGAGFGSILRAASAISLIHGTGVTNARVELLQCDGNQSVAGGAAGADAITFDGASVNCIVRGCYITKSARDGITFRGTSRGCAAIDNVLELCREDGIGAQGGEGHRIIGNYIRSIWGDGIFIKGTVRTVIAGNVIDTPGTGAAAGGIALGADGSTNNDYIAIIGNTIANNASAGSSLYIGLGHFVTVEGNTVRNGVGIGLTIVNTPDSVFKGNTFDTITAKAIEQSGGTVTPERNVIEGNVIRASSGSAAIDIIAGVRTRIIGNVISGSPNRGIQVLSSDCLIEGNAIEGTVTAAEPGMRLAGSDTTCADNRISGVTGNGIWATGVRSVIKGNIINTCGARGILVDGVNDGVIEGNLVRDSTLEGILVNNGIQFAIVGNRSFGTPQTHGVRTTGTADWCTVVGNVCRGNVTTGVATVGANNQIANNVV